MLPERIFCLRCAFPRTVRLGARRMCFQCRFSWSIPVGADAVPLQPVLVDAVDRYPFTSAERARLLIYRRAVQAQFFSDAL